MYRKTILINSFLAAFFCAAGFVVQQRRQGRHRANLQG